MIIPAKAIPIYSYDEGIEKLNTSPLAEIDRLAEEFAMGEFDVNKGGHRDEFYKLLNQKLDQIPRIKAIREMKAAEVNGINAFTKDYVGTVEQLTTLYITSSLLLDAPETFKTKYPKFINSWLYVRRSEIPQGLLGLSALSMFQTVSIALNKEALTSELFIETAARFKDNPRANKGEIWDGMVDTIVLTNLRSIDRIDLKIPKMQEELIRNYLITRVNELKKEPKLQYKYLIDRLTPIIRGQYQFSFKGLDSWFDIIWANTNELNKEGQVSLLLDFYRSRANWELKISPNEYLNKTLKLVDGCSTPGCISAKSKVYAALSQVKRNLGKYEEAAQLSKKLQICLRLIGEMKAHY